MLAIFKALLVRYRIDALGNRSWFECLVWSSTLHSRKYYRCSKCLHSDYMPDPTYFLESVELLDEALVSELVEVEVSIS